MTCIVDIMRMKRTKHLWFAELTVVTFYCGDQITVCIFTSGTNIRRYDKTTTNL